MDIKVSERAILTVSFMAPAVAAVIGGGVIAVYADPLGGILVVLAALVIGAGLGFTMQSEET